MGKPDDYLQTETIRWTWWCIGAATLCFLGMSLRGICFGFLGEGVTLKVRTLLYKSILEKNLGFFDDRENNASVLTSSMAQDSSLINGVSTESLGPYTDAFFALFGGLAIGFYWCW